MAFRKGKKNPNCSITFSYRRKRKLFWGENWKNKPYLKRRLLDLFDDGLNHFSKLRSHPGFISRYIALSPLLHLFIPSLFNLSLSSSLHLFRSVPFLSLSSSHPKTAPSAPLLGSPLLHFFIPSLFNLSISPNPFLSLSHLSSSLHPKTTPSAPLCFLNFFFKVKAWELGEAWTWSSFLPIKWVSSIFLPIKSI